MRFPLLISCLVCVSGLYAEGTNADNKTEPPNVLFIAIDDLNNWTGTLGGHPDARTPNIDRLIARGMNFSQAYCASPACGPSRAAIMSGLRADSTGVYMNGDNMRESPVLKDAIMLPQYFQQHGYVTMRAGKIYHNPDPRSWDVSWPSPTKNKASDPHFKGPKPAGSHKGFYWGALDEPVEQMSDWQVADFVTDKLLNPPEDKPLFLACGFFRPHLPWTVPRKYFEMFPLDSIHLPEVKEGDIDDLPRGAQRMLNDFHKRITDAGAWKEAVQAYLASMAFADDCVGRILDALDKSPRGQDTIVVLWSDHGWDHGQKERWSKFALWEQTTQSVLAFVVPGVTRPDETCATPVNLVDIYPTLVALCGLPPKPGLDGHSLVPLLQDPEATWGFPSVTTYREGNHSLRNERWRYIRYANGDEELYDHDADPLEWTNLAGDPQYTSVKEELAVYIPESLTFESTPAKKKKKKDEDD